MLCILILELFLNFCLLLLVSINPCPLFWWMNKNIFLSLWQNILKLKGKQNPKKNYVSNERAIVVA